jgi:hypothetical protein
MEGADVLVSHAAGLIRRYFLPVLPILAFSASATTGVIEPFACRSEPSPVSRIMRETTASVNMLAKTSGADRCAAYQHLFLEAVKAREALVICSQGDDRDRSVARLDGAIEAMNSGIAENCGLD